MIKVSIIIPSYKRIEQTLKTISLLLSSEGIDIQYRCEIIIADSSPDNLLQETLTKNFRNNVTYTRPNKPGIASNKNQGARIAKNPILVFCDSDMEVEKSTLLNSLKSLENNPTAGAIGGQVIWKGGPKDGKNDRPREEDRMITIDKTTYVEAIYSRYIATYEKVFWEVGGYDEEVFNMRGEGSDLSVRYWRSGYPLGYDSSIIVHHVHEVEGGIIRGVQHPEWGIAKDLLLLAYKYDILNDKYKNFINTVTANFKEFAGDGYWRIIQGIARNMDLVTEVKPLIDKYKSLSKPTFKFKFLEIFSEDKLFRQCLEESEEKLENVRKNTLK